jgi:MurNAc alpha-1-phosphate uridylyltransferase
MTAPSPLPAIILAGGLGTRLHEITKDRWPKPMTPVRGLDRSRPFLEWPLAWLRREGICDVVICIGHLGERVSAHFGDGRDFGLRITYDDAGDADTGARCRAAFRRLTADMALVICGDVMVDFDTARFLEGMARRPKLMAKLALAQAVHGNTPNIAFDANGLVTAYKRRCRRPADRRRGRGAGVAPRCSG